MNFRNLNTSYKFHFLIALIISIWLVVFLILIGPFDVADIPFVIRLEILPFYGVISFFSYIFLIPIQNWIFKKTQKWTILLEVLFVIFFSVLSHLGSYLYYKSDIINGTFDFKVFTLQVYYPIFFVLLSILFFVRWFLNKKSQKKQQNKILLTGDNKLDALRINFSDLVTISSADNYVEVSYLKNNVLCKKLLRNTLKSIELDQVNLLRVHRSHLVNPSHIIDWKNNKTLRLTKMEVPISKNYKEAILAITNPSLKMDSSPQTPYN